MRFVSSDSIVLFMYFANLKSGLGSCIAPKAGLARHPAKGMYGARVLELCFGTLVSCCPGPGSSWGNLDTLPPSKEGKSPSKPGYIGRWGSFPLGPKFLLHFLTLLSHHYLS